MKTMILLCASMALPMLATAAVSWEALPDTLKKSPASLTIKEQGQASALRQTAVGRSFAPRLQAFGQGRFETADPGSSASWPEAGLRAQANVWKGGRDGARASRSEAEARAGRALALASEAELLQQARLAWIEAWQARQRIQALKAALLRCDDDKQRTRRQAQAGLVAASDALALEVLSAELDQHVFDEGHLADEAEHHLAALLGLDPAQAEGLVEGQALTWPQDSVPSQAKSWQQSVLSAEIDALSLQSSAVGGNWQPSFDLESQAKLGRQGYGLSDSRDFAGLAVLSLAWDPASAQDKEQSWLQGLARARQSALEARRKAEIMEVEELGHALKSWIGRKEAVEKRIEGTNVYRKAVMDENARGVRDSRDLSESNQAILEAELDATVAQARAWSVWSQLQIFETTP